MGTVWCSSSSARLRSQLSETGWLAVSPARGAIHRREGAYSVFSFFSFLILVEDKGEALPSNLCNGHSLPLLDILYSRR